MNIERWILIGIIIFCIFALIKIVPNGKAREAWVLFLFLQVITWPAGLLAVELGWIDYPVQLFPKTNQYNRTSFSFEFFFFPVLAIIFSLYYPSFLKKWSALLYYLLFAGFFTIIEVILEKYTDLVEYYEWKWYWTFSTLILSLYLNHKYYLWFKKRLVKVGRK